jgi:hypothetical protein
MGRLVKGPEDILIYGRAVGMSYKEGRDDATPDDIKLRAWKATWPHCVRVHHAEFLSGSLSNGISLYKMMHDLSADVFATTQYNARIGDGNINPRRAYIRQAAVELSAQSTAILNDQLEQAFALHGRLSPKQLGELDWPA